MNHLKQQLCLSNFKYFCKLILGWEYMGRMHREIIESVMGSDNNLVVLAPRGHWKTSLMSVAFPLWIAYRSDEPKEIVITAASLNQSSEILEKIKGTIDGNEYLKKLFKPENIYKSQWSASKIKLKTGTRISVFPFGSGIRGVHPDYCICDDILKDESANIDYAKDTYYSAVYPITQAKNGKQIVIGTPMAFNDLLADLKHKETFDSLEYSAILYDDEGNWKEPLFPEHFTMEKLKDIKSTMPAHLWSREYECKPISSDTALFPLNLIQACLKANVEKKEDKDYSYYMGCDIALSEKESADFSVFTIIRSSEDNPHEVIHIDRMKGISTNNQVEKIARYHKEYGFSKIIVEKRGLSYGMVNDLINDDRVKNVIEPFITNNKNKEEILSNLEVTMRHGNLKLLNNDTLINELLSFGIKIRNGKQTYEGLSEHDDCVISLALALEAATNSNIPITMTVV